jgi:ABC-type dipeptide/oligopeptide/nickel transport system permease subunit
MVEREPNRSDWAMLGATGFIKALESIVMRLMSGLMSIPAILLAIALVSLTKTSD